MSSEKWQVSTRKVRGVPPFSPPCVAIHLILGSLLSPALVFRRLDPTLAAIGHELPAKVNGGVR